ncbi:hypothetical protein [Glaciimonas immobilis]|uniref:Uncharacterized protein n=1 Tax=Glaciimonas immobilis TaxID=728004 RepID=A0A840RRM4_9BURK|nr:hypothetical protein [Glaciimonas immobilis]KAF3998060.1 hypothetical protein HAV38_10930 [Glaciimonas immobilis]MBB5199251.1 hypothetical protein [Glaciimonas immobilis]
MTVHRTGAVMYLIGGIVGLLTGCQEKQAPLPKTVSAPSPSVIRPAQSAPPTLTPRVPVIPKVGVVSSVSVTSAIAAYHAL